MADESPATGSLPETVSEDAPVDVDFTALMTRSQAQLIDQTGKNYEANADLRQKLVDFGLGTPAP
jgi:hypothetical protein